MELTDVEHSCGMAIGITTVKNIRLLWKHVTGIQSSLRVRDVVLTIS